MSTGHGARRDYDAIGGRYRTVKDLPCAEVEGRSIGQALGTPSGARVLDLACGTGHYTRHLSRRGAAQVLGVDVSAAMIAAAQQDERDDPTGAEFAVADARDPRVFGVFDVVLAVWLLNYADTVEEMAAMFATVRRNLTQDGTFVGVTQNPWFDFDVGGTEPYGWSFVPGDEAAHARRVAATAHVEPPVSFSTWFPMAATYDVAAGAAGLGAVRWHPLDVPPGATWDGMRRNPPLAVLTVRRADR